MDAQLAAARIREALEEYDACTNYEQEAKASRRLDSVANPEALRALLAERDELAKDAARYRLLRANHWRQGDETLVIVRARSLRLGAQTYSGHLLDEAVDPALTNKD